MLDAQMIPKFVNKIQNWIIIIPYLHLIIFFGQNFKTVNYIQKIVNESNS